MDKKGRMADTAEIPEAADIPTITPEPASSLSTPVSMGLTPKAKKTLLIVVVLLGAFGMAFLGGWAANVTTKSGYITGSDNDGNLIVSEEEQNIAGVVNKVSPSVVSILTTVETASWYGEETATGAGSGMVVSKDGYILTNKHVVEGATKATVALSNGKTYQNVPVVGSDPLNDLAFLKIPDVNDLSPVELGDSKTVRVGQQVIAIGNALGQYQNSVTSGIISGLGRPVSAESESGVESLSDLLQTDAAINSGNSGGPLLNMQGQVIGINTAVASDAQNIGFAIPIGAVKGMLARLIATGELERAIVGVQYVSITPEVKAQYKLTAEKGDYVTKVGGITGSFAEKAGIKAKDIITKVNGIEVAPGKGTSTLVAEYQPGDTITLTILRGGKTLDLKVELAAYKAAN